MNVLCLVYFASRHVTLRPRVNSLGGGDGSSGGVKMEVYAVSGKWSSRYMPHHSGETASRLYYLADGEELVVVRCL